MTDKIKEIISYYWKLALPHLTSKAFWTMVCGSLIHIVSKTFHLGLTDSHVSGAAAYAASYIAVHVVHDAVTKKDKANA